MDQDESPAQHLGASPAAEAQQPPSPSQQERGWREQSTASTATSLGLGGLGLNDEASPRQAPPSEASVDEVIPRPPSPSSSRRGPRSNSRANRSNRRREARESEQHLVRQGNRLPGQ